MLELDDWSYDKILLFYRLARERIREDAAEQDIRMMRAVRMSIASSMSREGQKACERYEKELIKILGQREPDENKMARFIERLAGGNHVGSGPNKD